MSSGGEEREPEAVPEPDGQTPDAEDVLDLDELAERLEPSVEERADVVPRSLRDFLS